MAKNAEAKTTTDHDEIREWAEQRGGQPACVKGTGDKGDVGMLRIDFPGYSGEESLQHISWDDWFEKFDERNLALLHQEQTAGGAQSNFNKLVSRETAESSKPASARKHRPATKSASRSGSKPAAKKTAGRKSTGTKVAAKKAAGKTSKKTAAKSGRKTSAKNTKKTTKKSSSSRSRSR